MSIECSTSSLMPAEPVEPSREMPISLSKFLAPPGASRPQRFHVGFRINKETRWFWIMAGPALAGLVIFKLGPMLASGYLSLTRWDVVTPPQFIGLENYRYLITQDPAFWPSVKVTFIYAAT